MLAKLIKILYLPNIKAVFSYLLAKIVKISMPAQLQAWIFYWVLAGIIGGKGLYLKCQGVVSARRVWGRTGKGIRHRPCVSCLRPLRLS